MLSELAADVDERLAGVFDIEAVRYKHPVDYNESMNTGEQEWCLLGHLDLEAVQINRAWCLHSKQKRWCEEWLCRSSLPALGMDGPGSLNPKNSLAHE